MSWKPGPELLESLLEVISAPCSAVTLSYSHLVFNGVTLRLDPEVQEVGELQLIFEEVDAQTHH